VANVKTKVNSTVNGVRSKAVTARTDIIGRIEHYEKKYRPTVYKYNTWCGGGHFLPS
jgi:hypothetical protein